MTQAQQGLANRPFNAALPTVMLPANNVKDCTSCFTGEIAFGGGATATSGVSLSGNVSYQILRTDLLLADDKPPTAFSSLSS